MYEKRKENLVKWIRDWFAENGPESIAIIGISGGKDSTITAALCKEALGADRVLGIIMPNGIQRDIEDSYAAVKALEIPYYVINIGKTVGTLLTAITNSTLVRQTEQMETNLPPKIRMTTLYAIAQGFDPEKNRFVNGRVANTCNLSETMMGWDTRWGDQAGDFSPLGKLTKTEVVEIGRLCKNIPAYLVEKAPADGLTQKTDEENMGVSYEMIDRYLRKKDINTIPQNYKDTIERRIRNSRFKRESVDLPAFNPMDTITEYKQEKRNTDE